MKLYKGYDWLFKMYITNNLSQASIARLCGVNQSIIHRNLVKLDIPTRKFCGRAGKYSGKWKGGRYKASQGYIYVMVKGHPRAHKYKQYVPEQILVAENKLGRYLGKNKTIHHLNFIKDDNRLSNLFLFKNESEHQRYHRNYALNKIPKITKSNLL